MMVSETQAQAPLPVIDFADENMKPGTDTWVSCCKVVRSAFEDHGGFLALYDKVDPLLYDSVFSSMEQLFDLPLETKMQPTTDKPIYSYAGQRPDIPLYESMAIDNPLSAKDCHKYTTIMWPQGNHSFSESVSSYTKKVAELDYIVKRMVFESYGLDNQKCESLIESTDYVLRCYKYRTPKVGETNAGVHPHTDSGFLTILNQRLNGLEIQLKDGEWFQVDASPSMFAVLAGDAFMVWSNDRIRGCMHRVFMNSNVDRYSLGLLSYAGKVMEPQEELVDEEHPLRYKPFDHYGYLRFFLTEEAVKSASRIKAYCGV
ncbi:probable 2-oxoglutarate-dependent dioxygenase AOP1 [Abrus precatorius]|uniref:Probable 2-oxoglutarate-dependent dioxygenase AOP1 n=1 Tax=Abrus precatorius TaxID=3816 RepID=A0A8B8LB00_ABRPR|nr:probable 2-oxoglutarate-dependent dioxygenase AOP1 [Abrus precatorius]